MRFSTREGRRNVLKEGFSFLRGFIRVTVFLLSSVSEIFNVSSNRGFIKLKLIASLKPDVLAIVFILFSLLFCSVRLTRESGETCPIGAKGICSGIFSYP
ncbi:hypothetical protein BMS3Bbin07_00520 [bacterium BMS3Bbin07]|nr:hypothetical protein BMS3Bbin07_00520 [bacterium BMS3Bbin07]